MATSWRGITLKCLDWRPHPHPTGGGLVGYADIMIQPPGIVIQGSVISRTALGHLRVMAPRLAAGKEIRRTFCFLADRDWRAFGDAAAAAIEAAFPGALSET